MIRLTFTRKHRSDGNSLREGIEVESFLAQQSAFNSQFVLSHSTLQPFLSLLHTSYPLASSPPLCNRLVALPLLPACNESDINNQAQSTTVTFSGTMLSLGCRASPLIAAVNALSLYVHQLLSR